MKIKIIDDDIKFINKLNEKLKIEFNNCIIDNSTYFDNNYSYDIYFLDIDMPDNGIELANKLKSVNEDILIIFISFRDDLIFEALKTFPYYFIRKKYLETELPIIINKIKKTFITNNLPIYYKGQNILLDIKKILYVEKNGQYTHITTKKHTYIVKHSLKYYENFLPKEMFGNVSQSFIANFKYVLNENNESVVMKNGYISYYSRGRRKPFLENYLKYISKI